VNGKDYGGKNLEKTEKKDLIQGREHFLPSSRTKLLLSYPKRSKNPDKKEKESLSIRGKFLVPRWGAERGGFRPPGENRSTKDGERA